MKDILNSEVRLISLGKLPRRDDISDASQITYKQAFESDPLYLSHLLA